MSEGIKFVYSIIRNGASSALLDLPESHFIRNEVTLYRFVREYFQRHKQLPSVETAHEETGVAPVITTEPVSFYRDKLDSRNLYTQVRPHLNAAVEAVRDMNPAAIKESIANLSRVANSSIDRNDTCDAQSYANSVFMLSDYRRSSPDDLAGIPTGYPALDLYTGGYRNGTRITWVARPKMGKTTTLCKQILAAVEAGRKPLVVTMEMSGEQFMQRLIAVLVRINPRLIETGHLSTRSRNRAQEVTNRFLEEHPIDILAGAFNRQISSIEAKIHSLSPDAIYIDNAYHLHPSSMGKRGLSRVERAPVIEDELNELALKVNRPIISTAQFAKPPNTATKEKRRGDIDTIGLTDAVAQNNAIVIGIHKGPRPRTKVLEVLAAREGGMDSGDVLIAYDYQTMNFDQLEIIERQEEDPDED